MYPPRIWAVLSVVLFAGQFTAAGRPKTFNLKVTWASGSPDGFSREMFYVNGQSPGPTLYLNEGEEVHMVVENSSPVPLTIHSHGIEQSGTPWSDGVPGVTQKMIKPGKTFTYKWNATQYGDYWYHSHSRGHISDGLYGQIHIAANWIRPTPFYLVTNDSKQLDLIQEAVNSPKMMAVSDWSHSTSEEAFSIAVAANVDPGCSDSLLVNGKGAVNCQTPDFLASQTNPLVTPLLVGKKLSDKGCLPIDLEVLEANGTKYYDLIKPDFYNGCQETKGSKEVFQVDARDGWAAFSILSASTGDEITISLDSHSLILYAVDGSYIIPQMVDAMALVHGSRYSVLVNLTSATPSDYTLRLCSSGANQVICGYATVSYKGSHTLKTPAIQHITYGARNTSADTKFLIGALLPSFPPETPPEADAMHVLSLGRTDDGMSWRWKMSIPGSDGAVNQSAIPYATSLEEIDPILYSPSEFISKNLAITTINGSWVDIVMVSEPVQVSHPIHKHSNKAYLIGMGTGEWTWNSTKEAAKANPQFFNLQYPSKLDTFYTLAAFAGPTWTVIRYQSVNPGPFILHCHFTSHLMGGMQVVLLDGVDKWPAPPTYYLDQYNL